MRPNPWSALLVSSLMVVTPSGALAASLEIKATLQWPNGLVVPAKNVRLIAQPDYGLSTWGDINRANQRLGLTTPSPERYVVRQAQYDGRMVVEQFRLDAFRRDYLAYFGRLEADARKTDPRKAAAGVTDGVGRVRLDNLSTGRWIIAGTDGRYATWSLPVSLRDGMNYVELTPTNTGAGYPLMPLLPAETTYVVTDRGKEYARSARPILDRVQNRHQQELRAAEQSAPLAVATTSDWIFPELALLLGGGAATGIGLLMVPVWAVANTLPNVDRAALNDFAGKYALVSLGALGVGVGMGVLTFFGYEQKSAARARVGRQFGVFRGLGPTASDQTIIEMIHQDPALREALNREAGAR